GPGAADMGTHIEAGPVVVGRGDDRRLVDRSRRDVGRHGRQGTECQNTCEAGKESFLHGRRASAQTNVVVAFIPPGAGARPEEIGDTNSNSAPCGAKDTESHTEIPDPLNEKPRLAP